MELIGLNINWLDFVKVIVFLTVLYFMLTIVGARLWTRVQHKKPKGLIRFLHYLYWPIAGIILLAVFISMRPLLHGLIFLLLAAPFWSLLKNFYLGTFLKYRERLIVNKSYSIGDMTGKLIKLLGTSAEFKTSEGMLYMPYSSIAELNITHLIEKNNSCELHLDVKDGTTPPIERKNIVRALYDCPLINWQQKPEINKIDQGTYHLLTTLKNGVSHQALISFISQKMPTLDISQPNPTN